MKNSPRMLALVARILLPAVAGTLLLMLSGGAGCAPPPPQHGTELLLAVDAGSGPSSGTNLPPADLRRAHDLLLRRLDRMGARATAEEIQPNLLRVRVGELPAVSKTNLVRALTREGVIELRLVHPDSSALLQNQTIPAGCEVLTQSTRLADGSSSNARFVVQQTPLANLSGRVRRALPTVNPMSGQSILFDLDDAGANAFAQITGDHVGRQLAIVLDGALITAPIIRSPITGGRAEISGKFTPEETLEIALALETSLDMRLRVIEEKKF